MGTIYLLHFDRPYKHARHYLGWTRDLPARIARHFSGHGSKLMRAVQRAGIGAKVVRTWPGDRHLERALKNRKNGCRLCPECR